MHRLENVVASFALMAFLVSTAREGIASTVASNQALDGSLDLQAKVDGKSRTSVSNRQAARLLLEFRLMELDRKLDTLWSDSLRIPASMRTRYRNALLAAKTVRDNTKVRLEHLRIIEGESNPKKWEKMRARTEKSLEGLRYFFLSAESARKPPEVKDSTKAEPADPKDI